MTNLLARLQSFCLALLLTVAVGIGCGFLTAGLFSTYYEFRRDQVAPRQADFGERVLLLPDGTPIIERREYWTGRMIYLDSGRGELAINHAPEVLEAADLRMPREWPDINRIFRTRWAPEERYLGRVDGREDWYMLHGDPPEDRMYLVGYDRYRRSIVGYFGVDGFQKEPIPIDRQFVIDSRTLAWGTWYVQQGGATKLTLMHDGEAIYLDLATREITRPFGAADVVAVGGMHVMQRTNSDDGVATTSLLRELIAVRAAESVRVYDWTRRLVGVYAIPPVWASMETVEFSVTADNDGVFLAMAPTVVDRDDYQEISETCITTTMSGEVSETDVILRRPSFYLSQPVVPRSVELNTVAAGVPAPLAGLAIGWLVYATHDEAAGVGVPEPPGVVDLWPALVFVFGVGAICVVLADRRQRAYGQPRDFFWLMYVFVLGLPGYVGYVCHRRWPVREPAAPPQSTGCEIFDRPRVFTA